MQFNIRKLIISFVFLIIFFILLTNLFIVPKQNSNKHEAFYFTHSRDDFDSDSIYTVFTDSNSSVNVIFNTQNTSLHTNNYMKSTDFEKSFSSNNHLETIVSTNISENLLNPCPQVPPNLIGPITADTKFEPLEKIECQLSSQIKPGGYYRPKDCLPRYNVAIIVPFRDRYTHLPIFLKNIHPFLMKQNIEYEIFVIEQTNGKPFNRAALMNIGFLEANKLHSRDCFIFHDVDLLPLDDRNLYTCPAISSCRHHSVAIDIFGFRLPYNSIFGGVSSMNTNQFKTVNGFSNSFWGWGGEDDDMSNRLKHANYHISRYPMNIARYMMLNHKKEKANPKRYENLANGVKKWINDGINSIKYDVYSIKKLPLFTWILTEIKLSEHSS